MQNEHVFARDTNDRLLANTFARCFKISAIRFVGIDVCYKLGFSPLRELSSA